MKMSLQISDNVRSLIAAKNLLGWESLRNLYAMVESIGWMPPPHKFNFYGDGEKYTFIWHHNGWRVGKLSGRYVCWIKSSGFKIDTLPSKLWRDDSTPAGQRQAGRVKKLLAAWPSEEELGSIVWRRNDRPQHPVVLDRGC